MNTPAGRTNANAIADDNAVNQPVPPLMRQPLIIWALVMAAAMMSFYVHLLGEQVQRGERLRQAQRGGMPLHAQAMHEVTPAEISLAAAR